MIQAKLTKENKSYYIAWLALSFFYLYQYLLRISPGILIEEIRNDFRLNAEEFAFMGAISGYGYCLMQIPVGILVDRIGLKVVSLYSIALCILGTLLMAFADHQSHIYFSRFIIGLGSASAFMGALKIANDYLPENQSGILTGATLTFGACGAILAGFPMNYLLSKIDSWQHLFLYFAYAGIAIFIMIVIYGPKKYNIVKEENIKIWQDILHVIKNREIIKYAIIAIGLFVPLSVMADLWGTAFLMKKFAITRQVASPILMNMYFGMALGSIILPIIGARYNSNIQIIKYSALLLFALFAGLITLPDIQLSILPVLLFIIGFFCGAEMLCFSEALNYSNKNISGLTIGIVNSFNMISGALFQQFIGLYLDFTWTGKLNKKGLRIYNLKEYIEAFSILVIIIGICALIAFRCKSKKDSDK